MGTCRIDPFSRELALAEWLPTCSDFSFHEDRLDSGGGIRLPHVNRTLQWKAPLMTGVGKCPNKTSPNYWGYHIQQIFEGDVQNPQKGTHHQPLYDSPAGLGKRAGKLTHCRWLRPAPRIPDAGLTNGYCQPWTLFGSKIVFTEQRSRNGFDLI